MRYILKGKWLIVLLWIALTGILMFTAPDMSALVREKGQIRMPEGYSSSLAKEMLQEKGVTNPSETDLILVFNREGGLTAQDKTEIGTVIDTLKSKQSQLGITKIMSYLDQKELEDQMISKDGQTLLIPLKVNEGERTVAELRTDLEEAIPQIGVDHYLTGESLILEDVVVSSEKGLHRTELITVVFILAVLLMVFRSPVAPFLPLFTVGFTYLVSQSVVAFLVDRFNFPLSNFTQIFLVGILFGIGTDYCILLLSRLKEEMGQGNNLEEAITRTYKAGGKTVFYAALAGLVGFATMALAKFNIYQSAVAVAVGIAFLLLALFSLVPALMAIFGKKMFWPAKNIPQHKQSKWWGITGNFALTRPWLALLLVAVVAVPFLATYHGKLSYNSMSEIGSGYESVKGFDVVADHFGPGEMMTGKIVIEYKDRLDNQEGLTMIEQVSAAVAKVDGVSKVRSATRPAGELLTDFQVNSQAAQLADGLDQGNEGITQIRSGLSEAATKLQQSAPQLEQATTGIDQLIKGTKDLESGVGRLSSGLTQVESGIRQGVAGAGSLQSALKELKANGDQVAAGSSSLLAGYQQAQSGLAQLSAGYKEIGTQLKSLGQALNGLDNNFSALTAKYPQLATDIDFQTIVGTVTQVRQGIGQLNQALQTAQASLDQAVAGLGTANQNMAQVVKGMEGINQGMAQLADGAGSLQQGMNQAAGGQGQIIDQMGPLSAGLKQFSDQSGALAGFSDMKSQLTELSTGLSQSADGLGQVSEGLKSAGNYLDKLAETDEKASGLNIPDEALSQAEYAKVLDNYLSQDHKLTTIDVVLKDNPYSKEALDTIEKVHEAADQALQGTNYASAKLEVGGVSSSMADVRTASGADYKRTMMLMLGGIALILVILLRSLTMPIYLVISLLLCYYTSMSITELIFVNGLGYDGLTWAVQFFGFVVLMALGVDYSIFLMDRFNEEKGVPVKEAILSAMKNMGTVIISAVIILGGTFAAMMPSGVLSLLQIATVVLSGLLLYAFVILPFFVPVMVRFFGQGNFWPFNQLRKKEKSE